MRPPMIETADDIKRVDELLTDVEKVGLEIGTVKILVLSKLQRSYKCRQDCYC